jgi:hypothetical protein
MTNVETRLPPWLSAWFLLSFAGVCWMVGRMVWEQTLLTWRQGPQMVGFTLAHAQLGLLFFFLISLALFMLAYLAVLVVSVVAIAKRRRVPPLRWLVLAGCALVVSLLFVPYSMWQRMFVEKLARGPHAADFLTYSAATGDLGTVEAFLQRGLSIDARDRDGSTALQGAAVGGQIEVVEYLVAHGANPNLRNDFGNTALDNAREMKRPKVVSYLERHGAK